MLKPRNLMGAKTLSVYSKLDVYAMSSKFYNKLIEFKNLVLVPKQGVELPRYPWLGGGGRVVGVADAGPPGLSLVKPGHVIRILVSHWMIM